MSLPFPGIFPVRSSLFIGYGLERIGMAFPITCSARFTPLGWTRSEPSLSLIRWNLESSFTWTFITTRPFSFFFPSNSGGTIGDKLGEGNNLKNIGIVYSDMGKKEKALEYLNQALEVSDQNNLINVKHFVQNAIRQVEHGMKVNEKFLLV